MPPAGATAQHLNYIGVLMKMASNPLMSRLRFAAYIALLIVAIVLTMNLDLLKVVPSILVIAVLLIIKAAAIPFIFGFILQGILYRKNIPKIVSLLLAVISIISLWLSSGYQFFAQGRNLFIELFLVIGSIIVVKGFIDSGVVFFQKIRDKHSYNKSLKRDEAKDRRAP
jgi:uncharacterized membrane protein